MAVITNSTFDPLKARCNVRLQQGVPIVDADWNEMDDIRKFELRAFLKWYVGDGIPAGSNGFAIAPAAPPATDDFIITANAGTAPAGAADYDIGLAYTGRCIADGLDVIITANVNYKAQTLFAAAGPAGAQIQPLPQVAGPVLAYLDISERLVTAQEDPTLILSGLGTESCARTVRDWCVRTRSGTTVPVAGNADYVAGHAYYPLASIAMEQIQPGVFLPIQSNMITDLRHQGLTVAALETRISRLEQLLLLPSFVAPPNQLVPAFAMVGQTFQLNGQNFDIGTPQVLIGNVAATISGSATNNAVTVVVPALAPGAYTVSITTAGGGPVAASEQFTVLPTPPSFATSNAVVPIAGAPGAAVTINGSNFNQAGLAVSFGATAATITNSGASQITVTVPNVTPGSYAISVSNAGGKAVFPTNFTVT
jgi:uncharacterized protein (DUF2141 family)